MNTENKAAHELSTTELEALLKDKKQKEQKKLEKEKELYESQRNTQTDTAVKNALDLFDILSEFKKDIHKMMDEQALKLAEYGKIRSNSKGGFTISNADDTKRITRRRDTEPAWDERSQKAIELIRDFLGDTIKKRDVKMYEILLSFLQRNEKGELEYSRVMDLYSHEDKFDDPRWKEGLRLIKESYSNHLKGFGYEFKYKDEAGKWQNILLNFSSL